VLITLPVFPTGKKLNIKTAHAACRDIFDVKKNFSHDPAN
jgi:hypothetical protein